MPWTQTDRAFKILINRRATSSGKQYYEEFGDNTINVHGDEVWTQTLPSDPAAAVSQGLAEQRTLFVLTEDLTVGSHQAWYAYTGGNRLKDWISDKYGSGYTIHLYKNDGTEVFPADVSAWFFDYPTGILTFNGTAPASQPFKITGYRYIGTKGVLSAVPYATDTTAGKVYIATNNTSTPLVSPTAIRTDDSRVLHWSSSGVGTHGFLGDATVARDMTVGHMLIAGPLTYPVSDGVSGQFMKTDGSGNLSFGWVIADGTTLSVSSSGVKVTNGGIDSTQLATGVAGAGLSGGGGSPLAVNVDGSSITISIDTLTIPAGGISNTLLAGSITDSKLNQITTTNKVAASAVEDKFIRNDSDDTSIGRIQANGFDANNYRISRVADATSNNDAATYGQLQSIATASRTWKETLLYANSDGTGQLRDGTTGIGGILAANAFALTSNFSGGEVVSLNDGTSREDYTAGTSFVVGGNINATLVNLAVVIDAAPIAASTTTAQLSTIDASNKVMLIWQDVIGSAIRVYGSSSAASVARILPVSSLYTGESSSLTALPTSDPGSTNFGFYRGHNDLVAGETHYIRENDTIWTWDHDADRWQMTGASALPFASKVAYGKVEISDGIAVSSGIISVQADGTTLSVGSGGVKITSGGVSSQELGAQSVTAAKLGAVAGNGLSGGSGSVLAVQNDGTTISVSGSGIKVGSQSITAAELGAVAGNGLTGGSGAVLAVQVDGTSLTVGPSGVKINSQGVNAAELGGIAGNGLTGGNGAVLAVLADSTTIGVSSSGIKLNDAAVTSGKIAASAVGYDKVLLASTPGLTSDGTNRLKVQVRSDGGILLDSNGLSVAPGMLQTYRMEQHTLTSGEISGKTFQLHSIPSDSSQVSMLILHGMSQIYASDYSVTDTTVGWAGLGLDGILIAGDVVQVSYPVAGIGLVTVMTNSGMIEAPANKTYVVDLSAFTSYTVKSMAIKTSSGTLTASLQIGSTPITGLDAISVTSSPQTLTASAANAVAIGDTLNLVVSGTSLPVDLSFSIKIER